MDFKVDNGLFSVPVQRILFSLTRDYFGSCTPYSSCQTSTAASKKFLLQHCDNVDSIITTTRSDNQLIFVSFNSSFRRSSSSSSSSFLRTFSALKFSDASSQTAPHNSKHLQMAPTFKPKKHDKTSSLRFEPGLTVPPSSQRVQRQPREAGTTAKEPHDGKLQEYER